MDDLYFEIEKDYNDLETFLKKKKLSQGFLGRSFRQGRVSVENIPATKSMYVKKGEKVRIQFEEEEIRIEPAPFQQEILFEDKDLLVMNKKANLAIMPCRSHPEKTFANEIAHYFQENGISRKIRLLGRLDKDTTGVMIVCKNPYALYALERNHTKNKIYHAIVCGQVKDCMHIDLPIGMGEDTMVREVRPDGQSAITELWPLKIGKEFTLVQLQLKTGRTHQIRCHLRHIGHPVLGDELYGGKRKNIGEIFLHVRELSIQHPRTNEPMTFVAPYPKDKYELARTLLET